MPSKILLTGASGHIGFHVVSFLLKMGYNVHLLIRRENINISILKQNGAVISVVDLYDPSTYLHLLDYADALFHLAAENTMDTYDEARVIQNTVKLTQIVLSAAVQAKVKTIIYTSSVVVLGRSSSKERLIDEAEKVKNPESPYVKGKLLADEFCEKLIQENDANIIRIYPSWVVGSHNPNKTPPHQLISKYLKNGQLFYFSGGISVANVKEVAKAHVNALIYGKPCEKYIVAGNNITFKEFYRLLSQFTGKSRPFLYMPKFIIYWVSILINLIAKKYKVVDSKYIKAVIGKYSWYSSDKSIKELNYSILPIEVTLESAIVEIKKHQIQTNLLISKSDSQLKRIVYDESDVLLITGFPGWLGNRFVDVFMNGDTHHENAVSRKVRLLVQPRFKGLIELSPDFEIIYGDLSSKSDVKNALKGVSSVYHLAGVVYPTKIAHFNEVNHIGTCILVDACIEVGVRRIIFMSTDSVCGYGKNERIFTNKTPDRPYKNYGKSKYLAEKYLLSKSQEGLIDGTSLRGFWFFGPFAPERNRNFFSMFKWKRQIIFGDGTNYRSISHVDNVIQAFIKAEKEPKTFGKWYWIGDERANYTVNEIYQHISDAMNVKFKPLYIPKPFCYILHFVDVLLSRVGILNPTIHAAAKFHFDIAGDISAAKKDFNYLPTVHFEEIKNEIKKMKL